MEPTIFKKFCEITYEKSGITLKPGKEALVEARVAKRQRALQIGTPKDYLAYLEADETGEELVCFLDAISTNFTHFFREKSHFEILAQETEKWLQQGSRSIRIWCAASSTGEEPYTIAMTMAHALEHTDATFKLLATDISTRVLDRAAGGVYNREQISPVERSLLLKYFTRMRSPESGEDVYAVKPSLKKCVVFRRLNLSAPPFPMHGPLDAVFCRNVMIYFDHRVRERLINEIERLIKPGGILFIGHSETLAGINCDLKLIKPSVYRKPKNDGT